MIGSVACGWEKRSVRGLRSIPSLMFNDDAAPAVASDVLPLPLPPFPEPAFAGVPAGEPDFFAALFSASKLSVASRIAFAFNDAMRRSLVFGLTGRLPFALFSTSLLFFAMIVDLALAFLAKTLFFRSSTTDFGLDFEFLDAASFFTEA